METESAVLMAAAYPAISAGHNVGDHWVQTHAQSQAKGLPGWPGRFACLRHVATLQATKLAFLAGVFTVLGLTPDPGWVTVALVVDGASHYLADRRTPLYRLAAVLERVAGKGTFWRLGAPRPDRDDNPSLGTGAYALDQAWHHGWCLVAAVLVAMGGTS